ncbi:hypothetical protein BOQ63_000060 (plasmid) [Streptomyces viridifaciens]|nr:hypothetical protein BOQ63_000060 [Streptomyces viridifaciens]
MTLAAVPDHAADPARRLADLMDATSPATRAHQAHSGTLPVLEPLRPLVPGGGLARGTVTEVGDASLLLAIAAGSAIADPCAWTAAVGLPDLGLAAAAGYGLDLRRFLVADDPGQHIVEVVTALAAACPVVLAAAPAHLPPRTLDRLAAHLRRTGTVLITPGPWPGARLYLEVTAGRWSGLGDGWGQLTGRRVTVTVTGRGSAVRARSAELWLPDANGGVSSVAGVSAGAAPETVSAAVSV